MRLISPAHDGEANCVTISHSGGLVATGGTDDMVKLWAMDSGELLAEGSAHSGHVLSLSFSPDDRQLVSVGEDGNVRFTSDAARSATCAGFACVPSLCLLQNEQRTSAPSAKEFPDDLKRIIILLSSRPKKQK